MSQPPFSPSQWKEIQELINAEMGDMEWADDLMIEDQVPNEEPVEIWRPWESPAGITVNEQQQSHLDVPGTSGFFPAPHEDAPNHLNEPGPSSYYPHPDSVALQEGLGYELPSHLEIPGTSGFFTALPEDVTNHPDVPEPLSHFPELHSITPQEGTGFDPSNHVAITTLEMRKSKKYQTQISSHKVDFNNLDSLAGESMYEKLRDIFNYIIRQLTENSQYNQVRFAINSPRLNNPININFMSLDELTADRILDAIERVAQSKTDFMLDDGFIVYLILMNVPVIIGAGPGNSVRHRAQGKLEDFIDRRYCVMKIENKDDLCLARAICVGRLLADKQSGENIPQKYYIQMVRDNKLKQTEAAFDLHDQANVPFTACGIEEARKFQLVLKPDYRIIIFSAEHDYNVVYCGETALKNIYILYHNNHYDVVVSPKALFNCKKFCHYCLIPIFNKPDDHVCKTDCMKCFDPTFHDPKKHTFCQNCKRFLRGDICYRRHLEKGICQQIHRCELCCREFKVNGPPHPCVNSPCKQCKIVHPSGYCYVAPLPPPKPKKYRKIYLDTETYLKDGIHTCILTVVAIENLEGGYETKVFFGPDAMKLFLDELLSTYTVVEGEGRQKRKKRIQKYQNIIVLAHNFSGFDGWFVLQYFYQLNRRLKPVFEGSKLMFLEVTGLDIKFLDTYRFVPLPLRDFPTTFQLGETVKTFFPYTFLTEDRMDYVGPLPDKKFFQPEHMKKDSDIADFAIWYENNRHNLFNLKEALIDYCKEDVAVLQKGFGAFQTQFLAVTGIDPILET